VDRVRAHRGVGRLLHAVSSSAVSAAHTDSVREGSRGAVVSRIVDMLVPASRQLPLPASLPAQSRMMLCGAAALFGVRRDCAAGTPDGRVTYVNPAERVAQDTRFFEQSNGLDVVELWLHTSPGHALDPDFLHALETFTLQLESDPRITAVDGPTSALRWARYIGDRIESTANIVLRVAEIGWRSRADHIDRARSARLCRCKRSRRCEAQYPRTREALWPCRRAAQICRAELDGGQAREPALRTVQGKVVGKGVLSAEITERLLPTLTESFALTATVIYLYFCWCFRSPTARLMTMIPSFFAILSAFLLMRLTSIPLNIATILIASTCSVRPRTTRFTSSITSRRASRPVRQVVP